jgi:hypothetical protein
LVRDESALDVPEQKPAFLDCEADFLRLEI